ncbi:MAG: hypothetical protein KKA05_07585 [Alphaproteobacteria bacterium]|nr:hypothetical protein [Alphaproteobacteria bacterium]
MSQDDFNQAANNILNALLQSLSSGQPNQAPLDDFIAMADKKEQAAVARVLQADILLNFEGLADAGIPFDHPLIDSIMPPAMAAQLTGFAQNAVSVTRAVVDALGANAAPALRSFMDNVDSIGGHDSGSGLTLVRLMAEAGQNNQPPAPQPGPRP